MASTGKRIADRRKELGLSRNELARRLKTSYLRVYRVEKGASDLPVSELAKWAKALDSEPSELVV